jgi:GT2 family glycosyltransferase
MSQKIARKKTSPKVSIIILNYNGRKWLEKCLPTVEKVPYIPLEIIVVNNGSSDDSAEYVKKNFPNIIVVEIEKNVGFAGGNNIGVKKATGKYILLLNNDTEVSPSFIPPMVNAMENDKTIGIIQPMLKSMRKRSLIDAACSFYTSTGFLYHYGYYQESKKKQYNKNTLVYSAKGACLFTIRNDYIRLGGLDEDFVCYVEESDFCHRMWLSGKKVLYFPESYIFHYGGGDMSVMEKSEITIFRSFRNRFYSYIKNLSAPELIKLLPVHFVFCELVVFSALARGIVKHGLAAQRGIVWWMFHMPTVLKKREYIQNNIRKVKDNEFLPLIKHDPPLSYYLHFLRNPEGRYDEKEI